MSINDQLDEEDHKLIDAALEKIFQMVTLSWLHVRLSSQHRITFGYEYGCIIKDSQITIDTSYLSGGIVLWKRSSI